MRPRTPIRLTAATHITRPTAGWATVSQARTFEGHAGMSMRVPPTPATKPPALPPRGERIEAGVGPVVKDGKPLVVRVGAVATDPRAVAAAAAITDQLRRSGVEASVVRLPNSELYSSALTGSRVDLVVGWSDGGIAPATALASLVDCDQPKTGEPEKKPQPGGNEFISNISGLCDAELIALARRALSAPDPEPLLDDAEGMP